MLVIRNDLLHYSQYVRAEIGLILGNHAHSAET